MGQKKWIKCIHKNYNQQLDEKKNVRPNYKLRINERTVATKQQQKL